MSLFPQSFFLGMVYIAITLNILGVAALATLLLRDWKGKSVW